jgi:hypothetical protein
MQRKLGGACLAVAALVALTAPAALASPVLTENFTPLAVGASLTATNTGSIKFTDQGITEECSVLRWSGTVLQNTGTKIVLEIPKGAGFGGTSTTGGPCTLPFSEWGFSWTFTSKLCIETVPGADKVSVTGCGAKLLFTIGECQYSAPSMTGTFVTNADATLTFTGQSFERTSGLFIGSVPCTTPASIDLVLDLTTTTGATLSIS